MTRENVRFKALPPHWRVERIKYLASVNQNTLGEDTDEDLEIQYIDISNVDSQGRVLEHQLVRFGDAPSRARRIVRRGDTIVSTVRTYLKAIAYIDSTDENLVCSTGFAVLTPKSYVHPKFLAYYARSTDFIDEVVARSVDVSYPAVNASDVADISCPVAPHDEQISIASFLDRETAKLDALVEKKQRLVELLQEKRQALITQAVTKGLDPNVPMKDSGIPWLGEVPAHWAVRRISRVAKMESGHTPNKQEPSYWDGDVPWVSLNDSKRLRKDDVITETEFYTTELGIQNSSAHLLPKDTVVFSRDATIGLCAILGRPMAVSQHFIGWVCGNDILPKYLLMVFKCMDDELQRLSWGSTVKTIGMPDVKRLVTPVPPKSEQVQIVQKLDEQLAKMDLLIKKIETQVAAIVEYRQALISAAVTGEIDVRHYADNEVSALPS